MAKHLLDSCVTAPYWDRDAPPRLTIESGDTVVFACPEPCGQVTPQWTAQDIAKNWDPAKVHALLGPVDVLGAAAGGSLDVEILDITHHGWAWSALIPGFGLLHERFPEPHLLHWRIDEAGCHLDQHGITVPYAPFVGCIGVAPAETGRLGTIPPRGNGGNLDLRDCGVGAIIRLPVLRDGAGLSIGDGHAAQGDGEVGGTAVEAPLTVTARISLSTEPADGVSVISPPRATVAQGPHLTTTAVGPNSMDAARLAVGRLLDQLTARLDLPEPVVMMLMSAVCDLRIAQAVNEPNWTVAASVRSGLLE